MLFDPLKNRWAFTPQGGMLSILLNYKAKENDPIGNFASLDLENIIYGWLGGYETELTPALHRCLDWLNRAIEKDESFGQSHNYHICQLHRSRAIVRWMLFGDSSTDDWRCASSLDRKEWNFDAPCKINFETRLKYEDRLSFLLQAEEHKEIEDLYSYVRKNRPQDSRDISTQATMPLLLLVIKEGYMANPTPPNSGFACYKNILNLSGWHAAKLLPPLCG